MRELIPQMIRTVVPIGVGVVATWLLSVGVDIDEAQVATAVSGVLSAVYYAVASWLERRYPWAGWLLGLPGWPTYGRSDG